MFRLVSKTKNYHQGLEKMQEMKTKLHYQFLKTNIPTTRHKQHFGFHSKFKPSNGYQVVNIKFLFYILI